MGYHRWFMLKLDYDNKCIVELWDVIIRCMKVFQLAYRNSKLPTFREVDADIWATENDVLFWYDKEGRQYRYVLFVSIFFRCLFHGFVFVLNLFALFLFGFFFSSKIMRVCGTQKKNNKNKKSEPMVARPRPKRWVLRKDLAMNLHYYEQCVFPEPTDKLAAAHEYWWADEMAEEQAMNRTNKGYYIKLPKNGGRFLYCNGDDRYNVLFFYIFFFFVTKGRHTNNKKKKCIARCCD